MKLKYFGMIWLVLVVLFSVKAEVCSVSQFMAVQLTPQENGFRFDLLELDLNRSWEKSLLNLRSMAFSCHSFRIPAGNFQLVKVFFRSSDTGGVEFTRIRLQGQLKPDGGLLNLHYQSSSDQTVDYSPMNALKGVAGSLSVKPGVVFLTGMVQKSQIK